MRIGDSDPPSTSRIVRPLRRDDERIGAVAAASTGRGASAIAEANSAGSGRHGRIVRADASALPRQPAHSSTARERRSVSVPGL